jgi:hypothetical protein
VLARLIIGSSKMCSFHLSRNNNNNNNNMKIVASWVGEPFTSSICLLALSLYTARVKSRTVLSGQETRHLITRVRVERLYYPEWFVNQELTAAASQSLKCFCFTTGYIRFIFFFLIGNLIELNERRSKKRILMETYK